MGSIAHKLNIGDGIRARQVADLTRTQPNEPRAYPVDAEQLEERRAIAAILSDALDVHGVTHEAVARAWGRISRQAVEQILSGEKPLSMERVGKLPKPVRQDVHTKLGKLWGLTSDEETVSTLLVEAVSLSVASAEVLDAARQGDGDAAAKAVARLTTVARRVAKAARGAKK